MTTKEMLHNDAGLEWKKIRHASNPVRETKKKGGARKVVSTYKNDLRLIRATNLDNLVRIGNGKTVTTLRKKRNKKDKRSSRD